VGGEDFVDAGALGALEAGIVGALPGGAAALDGARIFWVGLERRVWSGCNQIQCGFWSMADSPYEYRVRQTGLIFRKHLRCGWAALRA